MDVSGLEAFRQPSQIVKTFKKDLEQHFHDLVSGKAERVSRANDFARSLLQDLTVPIKEVAYRLMKVSPVDYRKTCF